MDYVIKENVHLDKLHEIFDDNSNSNAYDSFCIDDADFIKYVCLFAGIPIGYLALYPKNDFMKKEGLNSKFKAEENAVYIWHLVVKKAFEGKGVASTLLAEVIKKYSGRPIYSVMEELNAPAIKIHQRYGFNSFAKFNKKYSGEVSTFLLMKKK